MKERYSFSFSRWSLFFLLSVNLFLIIVFILTVFGVTSAWMVRVGWIPDKFYERPVIAPVVFALIASLFIGIATLGLINRVLIVPIHRIIAAMKQLAIGNFDVRIHLDNGFHTREIIEFSQSYNKAAEELGSVEILRKDFINNFSHEFKTPIISIKGFAQLLKDGDIPKEEMDEYLTIMINESDRLSYLATSILELSKIESTKATMEKEIFHISEQIRQTLVMMEAKCDAKELNLALELEDAQYEGNRSFLNHIWMNILDNAIKFSPHQSTISVQLRNQQEMIVFEVQDQGSGMNEETIAHIFDQFYQGDTSHASEGNGLGMTLVQKVLLLHDGQIHINSTPNQGTTITVTLPKRATIFSD